MSLRSRLLIAIGIIFVVALAVADLVTYSALESFLTNRVDQQLDQSQAFYQTLANRGLKLDADFCAGAGHLGPGAVGGGEGTGQGGAQGSTGVGGSAPAGAADGDGDGGAVPDDQDGRVPVPTNAVQVQAIQIRSATGTIVGTQSCAAYVDGTKYTPEVRTEVTALAAAAKSGGNPVTYFSAPSTETGGPEFRVRASVLNDGDVLVVAQPLGDIGSTLHHLLLVELAVTGGALVVALLGGLWLVRIGLRPLRDMEATAESIAAGNLTERVPGENDKTEVGRLARTLNLMLSRIESAFSARLASERRLRASEARLRRFVADASHELRTPIAAISAYAELFGRGASEQKEDLERLMAGIRNETGRMEHLVADLLLLARLDEGRPMEKRSVDVVALCAEAVQTASTVGPAWPLAFEASEPVEVMGDPTSLRQVVDNLLGNVRAHTPPGTTARVRVEGVADGVVITVADDGPGMEPEQAAHIFERFYRSDPSRSRAHGGAGLGLSIVSAIVAAHGGTVSAEARLGAGTTFTVHLPTNPPTEDPPVGAGADASSNGPTTEATTTDDTPSGSPHEADPMPVPDA